MAFQPVENPLRKMVREGQAAYGIYTQSSDPLIVELAAAAGFDFIRLDWSHAPYNLSILNTLIIAARSSHIVPFVRMEYNAHLIAAVLDMGAMGIIIPDVDSKEKAQAIVNAAKFPAFGERGFFAASRQAGFGGTNLASYADWVNNNIMVAIQIESKEGLDNLEEILSVPGIDVIHSGRNDLSAALGFSGQPMHPQVLAAEEKIFTLAIAKGLQIAPQVNPYGDIFQEDIQRLKLMGARIFSLGIDTVLIKKFFTEILAKARN